MSIASTDGIRGGMRYTPLTTQPLAADNKMQGNSSSVSTTHTSANSKQQSAATQCLFIRDKREINFNVDLSRKPEDKSDRGYQTHSFEGKHVKLDYSFPATPMFKGLDDPYVKHKDGTKTALDERGYSSAENFLADHAASRTKADKAAEQGFLTPAQQAKQWLEKGIFQDWSQQMQQDYEGCIKYMKGKSPSEKKAIAKEFYDRWNQKISTEMLPAVHTEMGKIREALHSVLERIEYNKENVYFTGKWAWTGDKTCWESDYRRGGS